MSDEPARAVKVGLLVTGLGCGGAERTVVELATRLDRARFAVTVGALQPLAPPDDFFVPAFRAAGVPLFSLDLRRKWAAPFVVPRLAAWLHRERIALLHTHLFHANLLGRLAARLAGGVPVVSTVHIADAPPLRWRFRLDRWTRGLVARETCVSAIVADFHARTTGAPREKLAVIPNGVDLARYAPAPEARAAVRAELGLPAAARLVGMVARLDPQKNQALLLEAFAVLAPALPETYLLLVGAGPLDAELRAAAARRGLSKRVIFTGARTDVPRLLAALDVFAFASRYEGQGLAVLEALAAARPVVVTELEVFHEVLGEGGAAEGGAAVGRIVPREPQALAAALGELLADPVAAAELGRRGRERCAAEYAVGQMVARYAALYEEVLGEGG